MGVQISTLITNELTFLPHMINCVAENFFRRVFAMMVPNETLYYFAIVLYVMLFFMQLIRKKYKIFQMVIFFLSYASIVSLIKLCIFPLMIGESPYQNAASLVPFSVLSSALSGAPAADGLVLQRFLALIAIAGFLGFSIPILLRKKSWLTAFLTAELFLIPVEGACIVLAQMNSSYKLLDTSVFILQPIAWGAGFLLFSILDQKTKLRSLCKEPRLS